MTIKSFDQFLDEKTVSLADAEAALEKKAKAKEKRGTAEPYPTGKGKKKFDAKQAFADAGVDLSK